ncbi:MAG: BCCT family transporter [Deltaproteobacteria bacterium]|jgi:choline-glycine betaine transporter|nr:BCCT family transporter [Deltaproteobacteria bacterium]
MSSVTSSKKTKWGIFLPPFLLVVALIVLNLTSFEIFLKVVNAAAGWILANFSWLFNGITCVCVVMTVAAYFSPFSKVRIGGSKAQPVMGQANFTWIALCTIMAAGILLWAAGEPMYHLYGPPSHIVEGAKSQKAVEWAVQTIFLEWTFSPMAIYGLPAVVFAFAFYNMKKEYSIGSMLYPALGDKATKTVMPVVDCVCLFALTGGMAASLSSGVLLLAGGFNSLAGVDAGKTGWIVTALIIVLAFVISASTGLMRGIRILSSINVRVYLVLGLFVFLAGPTAYLLDFMVEGLGLYLSDFFKISLWTSTTSADGWSRWWPTFYWCVWIAWMPVTSVFLGRVAKGYTVRETLTVIFVVPSIFSLIWLGIFSGTAINFELAGLGINEGMQATIKASNTPEGATYALFRALPLPTLSIPLFLLVVFVSFVTAADSNTNAMAGLCTSGLSTEDQEAPFQLKVLWGVLIGALCLIMMIAAGIDGVKMVSNLGGFPSLFLLVAVCVSAFKLIANPAKYDLHKEDYDELGRPLPSKRLPPAYAPKGGRSTLSRLFVD